MKDWEDWIRAEDGGAGNEKDRNDCHEPSVNVDLRN